LFFLHGDSDVLNRPAADMPWGPRLDCITQSTRIAVLV